MGMTIDDTVDFLNEAKKLYEDIANDPNINETIKTYFIIESLESAIDIMRKYQKIENILNSASYKEDGKTYSYTYDEDSRVKHIRQVVEDGNNSR